MVFQTRLVAGKSVVHAAARERAGLDRLDVHRDADVLEEACERFEARLEDRDARHVEGEAVRIARFLQQFLRLVGIVL